MALPNNVLQQVQTYQKSELAYLLNAFCFVNLSNKKFKDFENRTANLGDTVTFDLPYRFNTYNGLVVTFQDTVQRVHSLTCSQAANVSQAFSNQQFIFNVKQYMNEIGEGAVKELGTQIESDVALNTISGVRSGLTGALQTNSGPYRFYGDGKTPINSFGQLAQALSNFRDFGAAKNDTRGILPMTVVSQIVNSGLNQFTMDRNNEMAMSWMLGRFSECDWYESNLLPIHYAGTVGNTAAPNNILTVVSTNDPTGANITQITFSGAGVSDPNAIKAGDLLQFNDGVSGQPNLRFLTFIGHKPSAQPVQIRATADAGSDGGGNVTVSIYPPLVSQPLEDQNLNHNIAAGMKATPLPDHRAGLIYSGNALFLAMPQLPEEVPFPTANQVDKDSGAAIRHYYGSLFGQNQRGYVRDSIWGSTLVPEYSMRIAFPV
jgi:hypothetical protein